MKARILIAALIAAMLPDAVLAQANCALRTPDRQIFDIFPEATSFRTFEATLDRDNKLAIERKLGSQLAHTDEGKHTAYLVLKDGAPIGFVHARAEKGARGSVELVWAFDLDLTVQDFRVQRSREKHTGIIDSPEFRRQLVGRDLSAIRALLTKGNDDIDLSSVHVAPEARSIAHTAVLCALKTRVITEMAFDESLMSLRLLGHIHAAFPGTAKVKKAVVGIDAATAGRMETMIGASPSQLDAASVTVLAATGPGGTELGTVTRAIWSAHERRPEIWCAVGPDGAIRRAALVGEVDDASRQAFAALEGSTLQTMAPDTGAAAASPQRCGREVLALHAIVTGG